jgi:hypothetical protein
MEIAAKQSLQSLEAGPGWRNCLVSNMPLVFNNDLVYVTLDA